MFKYVLSLAFAVSFASAATIVDTLGTATPSTTFSVAGSGGTTIVAGFQAVGPAFTLTGPTIITEIGGFMNENTCYSVVNPLPVCPSRLPFLVEILPSVNGLPDFNFIPFLFPLPVDTTDPQTISYVSVDPNLLLPAGDYFALFEAQGIGAGGLLGNALSGAYQPGHLELGFIVPGRVFAAESQAAVRILGTTPGAPVAEPWALSLLSLGLIFLAVRIRRIRFRGRFHGCDL